MRGPWIQMSPTVKRQTIAVGETMSQMVVHLKGGSVLPAHKHVNEQIAHVVSGRIRMSVDGVEHELNVGDSIILRSNVLHGVTVDVDSVVIDTFSPPREDLLKLDREAEKS
jgi:quercetin dioxygenase-like cupin family protein